MSAVVVDVNGQPSSDPQGNSATCRAGLTAFAGRPTDVTCDGLAPVAWSDTTGNCTLNTGPEGADQQTDSRYGVSYFHLDLPCPPAPSATAPRSNSGDAFSSVRARQLCRNMSDGRRGSSQVTNPQSLTSVL